MSFLGDTYVLFKREMLVFKSKIRVNIARSVTFPLVLILLLGSIGNTISHAPVTIVDYANNAASTSFISAIQAQHSVSVVNITTQAVAISEIKSGQVVLAVIILPGFPSYTGGKPSVELYYTSSQVTSSAAAIQTVESIASSYGASIARDPSLATSPPAPTTAYTALPLSGPSGSYKDFLIGGILIMVAAFGSVFGGGMSIISDRSLGNIKAFLVAPINKNAIVLSRIFAGTVQSLFSGFVALGIGMADGATIAMGFTGMLWIMVFLVFVALGFSGLTILIASRITRVEVYTIVAQTITLPLWFLSGAFFPTTSLPSWVYPLSVINPLTYAADGIRQVMMTGSYPIGIAAYDVGIVALFAVVMLVLGFKVFKKTI